MNPKYIFIAVFAMCLFLGITLPALSAGGASASAANLPSPQLVETAAIPPTDEPTAQQQVEAAAISQAAADQPAAVDQPAVQNQLAAVEQPAAAGNQAAAGQAAPVEQAPAAEIVVTQGPAEEIAAPVFQPPEGLPSPTPPAPPGATVNLPPLETFVASVTNGAGDRVTGVYVPGLFALPVIEQPLGDENFVSGDDGVITRYRTPGHYGTIGLLAHNYLSGKVFQNIKPNQDFTIIYGDGRTISYRVHEIQYYQALSPHDPYSNFVDLAASTNNLLTYADLFNRVYTTPGQVVFQTCFEANGDPSWGRVFVMASPI